MLGNLLDLSGFEYQSSEEILGELQRKCAGADAPLPLYNGTHAVGALRAAAGKVIDVPMYQVDALVRRAPSLQKTREGRAAAALY